MSQISIIIPIFNVEQYLHRCLNSILAQTFTNWECILVDDGSPDNCGAICDEYAAKDSRFKVIHQNNCGVSQARANGVLLARSEWINFVDPDDYLPRKSLQNLLDAITNDAALVFGDGVCRHLPPASGWSLDMFAKSILLNPLGGSPCARLYRSKYLTASVFEVPRDITVAEDLIMNLKYAYIAEGRVNACNHVVYIYEPNVGGATNGFAPDLGYQQKFLRAKLSAVPKEKHQDIMQEICHANIFWWLSSTKDKVYFEKGEYMYYQELRALVKGIKLPLSRYLKILFYCTNPLVRFVVINMKKLFDFIKKNK